MKRLSIVIAAEHHVRNFMSSHVFELQGYEVKYFVLDTVYHSTKSFFDNCKHVVLFSRNETQVPAHKKLFTVTTYRFQRLSSSFTLRIKRKFEYKRINKWSLHHALYWFKVYIKNLLPLQILGNRIVYPYYFKHMEPKLTVSKELHQLISDFKPELIIMVSSAHGTVDNDIPRIARELGVPSLSLIDNWDNLSSKSKMWFLPDYVGVLGPQSKSHACKVQGFKEDQVFTLGTPRFDTYRSHSGVKPYKFRYAVFCGCAVQFMETEALKILDEEIESNPNLYQGLKIIYRPHPWRHKRKLDDEFDSKKYKNVILDLQMKKDKIEENKAFLPELDYYPNLLKNAEFIISPLSTMVLEAAICEKLILAIAYKDKYHITSPHNLLKYCKHLSDIDTLDLLTICHDKKFFAEDFRKVYKQSTDKTHQSSENISYFVTFDEKNYKSHLEKTIDHILQ